jgi:hypothetical protein
MKNYIFLLLLISNFSFSQEINGIYKSNLTLFRSKQNPEKNFTNNTTEFYITVPEELSRL